MSIYSDKVMRANALRHANRIRKMLGFPPVKRLYKGKMRVGSNCPITNTIYDDDISREEYRIETGGWMTSVSKKGQSIPIVEVTNALTVKNFVGAFDNGQMPDLILDSENENGSI